MFGFLDFSLKHKSAHASKCTKTNAVHKKTVKYRPSSSGVDGCGR